MAHRLYRLAATAALLGLPFAVGATGGFPSLLSLNTTGFPDSTFVGPPDDVFVGLGTDDVIYDFGSAVVINRPGAVDLNVYEVDWGSPEFGSMNVLVSQNGIDFVGIKATESPLVDIPGDSAHGNPSFGRSYDLGTLAWVRYVKIDGTGTGRAGGTNDFDLDAIGAHELQPVPEPASSALMAGGLAVLGGLAARRRRAP